MLPRPPELTARALLTGAVLGAALAPCNVYSGLKIGWSFNMSITALLLAFAFWRLLDRSRRVRRWEILESNINQTTASSAASIISGGLVAPIPALALISGSNLPYWPLAGWVFAVSFLGIWIAWYLREALIVESRYVFPAGVATAETMVEIFSHGREAMRKVVMLLGAGLVAALVKLTDAWWWAIPRWAPDIAFRGAGGLAGGVSLKNLTVALEPSLLLAGFGAIIGLRAGLSLLLGAAMAWLLLGPWALAAGYIDTGPADPRASWFGVMVEWLLWPGVSLMVAATLGSFLLRFIRREARSAHPLKLIDGSQPDVKTRLAGLLVASALAVLLQVLLFEVSLAMAVIAVPMAFALAAVAARVVGETGIPPIGAIGKVSQLGFGLMAPGQVVTNLMTANAAGGAAGQCADLLNDFKAGQRIGATPRFQVLAQGLGVLTGSLAGSLVYLMLVPDPAATLITDEWPAPAVATWKAVAEALQHGFESVPASARLAMLVGGMAGIIMALLERSRYRPWLPSAPALGLAFVIPASISVMMCFGAIVATLLHQFAPRWHTRFLVAAASGLVAGESIAGVLAAFRDMLWP